MINPETAMIEDTIPIDNIAGQIAISDDGQYLYVSTLVSTAGILNGSGTVERYQIQSHTLNLKISLGQNSGGTYNDADAMVVLPGQPSSILVALNSGGLEVFDGSVARPATVAFNVNSLYVRPSDNAIFGFGNDEIYWLSVTASGVSSTRTAPLNPNWTFAPITWNGSLATTFAGFVFDTNAGTTLGQPALPPGNSAGSPCILATDASGDAAFGLQFSVQGNQYSASLVQYSLATFLPVASASLTGIGQSASDMSSMCTFTTGVRTWGGDGILVNEGGILEFFHTSGLSPSTLAPIPSPTLDSFGVIHLPLPANGLAYDSARNLLWASIPGNAGVAGNSVVSIDPASGNVINAIYAGSEPGLLALSGDASHLFAALGGAPAIASVDLTAQQSSSFSLLDPVNSPYWVPDSLAAIAGASNSFLVARGAGASATAFARTSVTAYDAGIARLNTVNSGTLSDPYAQFLDLLFPADATNTFYGVSKGINNSDGTNDVFRLAVNSAGVSLSAQLNSLFLGSGGGANGVLAAYQPASLVYDSGRLFTTAGQLLTPDTAKLLATFATTNNYAFPVLFSDQNIVVFVQSFQPTINAIAYDLTTFRPLLTVPLATAANGIALNVITAVRAGSNTIAVVVNGQILLVPLSVFQPWTVYSGALTAVSPGIQQANIVVNAICSLPGSSNLLLATPDGAGNVGNSVVTYDPSMGQIENATFIGSEPSILAPTPDGSAVYSFLSGQLDIGKLNVATGTVAPVFAADPTRQGQQYAVYDMAVGPDGGLGVSIPGGVVAIFDNAVPRLQFDSNGNGPLAGDPSTLKLAFNSSGTILYGFNSDLSTFELKRYAVAPQGVHWLTTTEGLLTGYYTTVRYAQGLIYTSYGDVVDPEGNVIVGRFADPWLSKAAYANGQQVAVDVVAGRVYFATAYGILMFDINSYSLLGRLPFGAGFGSGDFQSYPQSLIRFGTDGLAFHTAAGNLYLVSISAIPLLSIPVHSPQFASIAINGVVPLYSSVPVVEAGSWISIYGANLATTTATWSGNYPTSLAGVTVSIDGNQGYLWYVSPNLINVQVPNLINTGSVGVTVTGPNGTATGSVTLSEFAPSLSLFGGQYVAGEILTPDGSGAYGGGTYDLVGPSGEFSFNTRPVNPGETLVLFGVGFGPTTPTVPAGRPFTGAAPTTNPVTVTIGSQAAKVTFSGMVASGLYQINVVVPSAPVGDEPLQATVGGIKAPLVTVTVQ